MTSSLNPPKPLITIKEARKLLGAVAKSLSDEEVLNLIRDYETLARYAVREYMVLNSGVVK